ncbi:hypothetical protein ACOME3_005710 [Neoechinorhynchus agilis]
MNRVPLSALMNTRGGGGISGFRQRFRTRRNIRISPKIQDEEEYQNGWHNRADGDNVDGIEILTEEEYQDFARFRTRRNIRISPKIQDEEEYQDGWHNRADGDNVDGIEILTEEEYQDFARFRTRRNIRISPKIQDGEEYQDFAKDSGRGGISEWMAQ